MKKLLIILTILSFSIIPAIAENTNPKSFTNDDVILYQIEEKWGLKDQNGSVLTDAIYKKMIRIGFDR